MSHCCGSYESFLAPPLPTVRAPLDPGAGSDPCVDPIRAVVHVMLAAKVRSGLTLEEIEDALAGLCGEPYVTPEELEQVLTDALKLGVLRRSLRDKELQTYVVNGAMQIANPANAQYMRPLCEMYTHMYRGVVPRHDRGLPRAPPRPSPCAVPVSRDGISQGGPIFQPCLRDPTGCVSLPY